MAVGLGLVFPFGISAQNNEEIRRQVNLEWEEVPGATQYEIQVTRILKGNERKKPVYFKLNKSVWSAAINPGQYEMLLRSYDSRGVPGEWSEPVEFWVKIAAPEIVHPKSNSMVQAEDDETDDLKLQWQPVEGAAEYEIEISSEDGDYKETRKTKDTELSLDLPVAKKYSWRVTAVMPEGERGEEWEAPQEFAFVGSQLEPPLIEKPISKFVQSLQWNRPEHAQSYSLVLFEKQEDGKLKPVEKQTQIESTSVPFDLSRPSGQYVLKLIAEAPLRKRSEISELEFEIKGGLRTPAAVEQAILKDSLEKPTHFYAIASYFITQMNYLSQKFETNQKAQFDAIGGTGRLGLGYQDPKSPMGSFAILDMGGFNIGNKNFNFASAELHGTWKLEWSSTNQVLVGAGVYYKELPEVQGNSSTGFQGVGKAQNIGPHAGMRVWFPLSQKLGVQLNGRVYYSLLGSSPSGGEVQPALSYQAGVLGSLRLSKDLMGYAGYAYRLDRAEYKANTDDPLSVAGPDDINSIQIQGHYLNLMLEYSF